MTLLELETEQERLEAKAVADAKNKITTGFIAIVEQGRLTETPLGQSLLRISIDLVEAKIKEYFNSNFKGLFKVDQEKIKLAFGGRERQLAYILLNSILTKVSKKPLGLVALSKGIIKDINHVLSVEKLQKFDPKVYSFIDYEYKKRGRAFITKRKIALSKLKGFNEDCLENVVKLGTNLVNTVLNSGIDIFTTISIDSRDTIQVGLSDTAMRLLFKHKQSILNNIFTYSPLVVSPRDHTHLYGTGGYLLQNSTISIVKQKRKHLSIIQEDFEKCTRLLAVINKVQKVEWCVNERVLDVMTFVIDNNLVDPNSHPLNPKLYGGIPSFESLDVYQMIDSSKYGKTDKNGKFIDIADYKRWYIDITNQQGVIDKIVSNRFGYMYAIDVAKRYLKYDKFYYTYQLDYRYRLYPLQQHLNPQQSGNIKALLQFYNGQILNTDGLYWFKIHGANCYGYDKEPYDIRIEKINGMIDVIKAIAEDPLGNITRWCDADSPYEFLAFCFSYNDYLKDNTATIHIPVALDATCSGIQIYSGLLKDGQGAKSVNVVGNTREDVYSDVAAVANNLLASGDYPKEITFKKSDGAVCTLNTALEANSLKGNITRKYTKRNVMTTPYSVTQRGMFDQVRDILKEDELDDKVWWKGDLWVVSKLISDINGRAISEVVNGATRGQEYIKQITNTIANDDKYLKWYSPIFNLPMLQRVPKESISRVGTPFGKLRFYKETDSINKQKMLSSIAPNFIHNLDAILMYLTVEKCVKDGVDNFWLIHDSYGVLPNDVVCLNKNIRDSYVELFSQPILKDWVEQLGLTFDESVMLNTLNLEEVYESKYIFS